MPSKDTPELTSAQLLALRSQPDALKTITELLRVKQMGPADHIRTKHEVKAFIEASGDVNQAERIVERARARLALQQNQSVAISITQRQRRGLAQ